jgi:hypothetical protein
MALAFGACVGSEASIPTSGDDASADTGSLPNVDAAADDAAKPGNDAAAIPDGMSSADAKADAGEAGAPPPPPPVPGKPGLDLTAGGNVSKSTSFKLVGAVGEAPGNNVVAKSTSYTLKGGVVAATQ